MYRTSSTLIPEWFVVNVIVVASLAPSPFSSASIVLEVFASTMLPVNVIFFNEVVVEISFSSSISNIACSTSVPIDIVVPINASVAFELEGVCIVSTVNVSPKDTTPYPVNAPS